MAFERVAHLLGCERGDGGLEFGVPLQSAAKTLPAAEQAGDGAFFGALDGAFASQVFLAFSTSSAVKPSFSARVSSSWKSASTLAMFCRCD